jgi:pimeloyl-ACP methyl ester carboxylesterase
MSQKLLPVLGISAALLLSGCGSSSSSSTTNNGSPSGNGGVAEAKTFSDQAITADDGETIAFTAYTPENPNGKAVPLILHGHGFGLSRAKNLENPNPLEAFTTKDVSGDVARQAWLDKGYYVISFDQRGFGDSTGKISVMDPDVDCKSISSIIDWAEINLPNLKRDNGDPLIGSVGLSYGGGFQTVCSSVDKRFDAIVPLATWSHLPYSLYADSSPKTSWLDVLGIASMGNLEDYLWPAFLQANSTGNIDQSIIDKLAGHGPLSYCLGERSDGGTLSTADALFIQGANDILFNANEAVENYECWTGQGRDTHLFVQREGHILPLLQDAGEMILFGTDETLYCDDQQFDTTTIALGFLANKLMGEPQQDLPDVCFSHAASQQGRSFSSVVRGGTTTLLPASQVIPGGAAYVINLLQALPLGTLLEVLAGLPSETAGVLQAVLGGLQDPASIADSLDDILNLIPAEVINKTLAAGQFIPLITVDSDGLLAGIPTANLLLEGGNGDGNLLYVGLGKRRGGDAALVNDQVRPVRGIGAKQLELVGVNEDLQVGDELGLMVYGIHPYYLYPAGLVQPPLPVSMNGTVQLPIHTQ